MKTAKFPWVVFLLIMAVTLWAREPANDSLMNLTGSDSVLDLFHGDNRNLGPREKQDGIQIIFHKATGGPRTNRSTGQLDYRVVDSAYVTRKQQAESLGYLWGAYMFTIDEKQSSDANDPERQADFFIQTVYNAKGSSKRVLLSVDLEDHQVGPKKDTFMSLHAVRQVVQEIHRLTGVWPGLYTYRTFIYDNISTPNFRVLDPQLATNVRQTLSACWLWVAQYENRAGVPTFSTGQPWSAFTIWQYTESVSDLRSDHIKIASDRRHYVGDVSAGDLNYIRISRADIDDWYNKNSWDYVLRDKYFVTSNAVSAVQVQSAAD
jgi:GH25 family lysozyme M1 (1,4-beta-N-acetylmuramidase)